MPLTGWPWRRINEHESADPGTARLYHATKGTRR